MIDVARVIHFIFDTLQRRRLPPCAAMLVSPIPSHTHKHSVLASMHLKKHHTQHIHQASLLPCGLRVVLLLVTGGAATLSAGFCFLLLTGA